MRGEGRREVPGSRAVGIGVFWGVFFCLRAGGGEEDEKTQTKVVGLFNQVIH